MKKETSGAAGRWQVERERCRIERKTPPPAFSAGQPISAVMPNLLKRLGLEDHHWMQVLEGEWPALVGESVARHTRPGRLQKDHLVIFVDSSVWLSELSRYGKDVILANLQKKFGTGKVRVLSLRLDPDGPAPVPGGINRKARVDPGPGHREG